MELYITTIIIYNNHDKRYYKHNWSEKINKYKNLRVSSQIRLLIEIDSKWPWYKYMLMLRFVWKMKSNSAFYSDAREDRIPDRTWWLLRYLPSCYAFSRGEDLGVALLCPNLDAPTARRWRPPSDFVDVRIHIRAHQRKPTRIHLCEASSPPYRIFMEHVLKQYQNNPPPKFPI